MDRMFAAGASGGLYLAVVAAIGRGAVTLGLHGAGKNTLIRLFTRMYDPDAGEIWLDEAPPAHDDLVAMRRGIAALFQNFAHFALTLAENIALGAHGPCTAEEAEHAARWSGAGGVDLSGDEWQKVALARAYIREAAIVVLDEPTAALDADAEAALAGRRLRRRFSGEIKALIQTKRDESEELQAAVVRRRALLGRCGSSSMRCLIGKSPSGSANTGTTPSPFKSGPSCGGRLMNSFRSWSGWRPTTSRSGNARRMRQSNDWRASVSSRPSRWIR
jgi:predicted ABC-type transport system involved in lysophospholipase L1 biosynthesis ATPase subunit